MKSGVAVRPGFLVPVPPARSLSLAYVSHASSNVGSSYLRRLMPLRPRRIQTAATCLVVSLAAWLPPSAASQQITAREVVARCAEAMAGKGGAEVIHSVHFLLRPSTSAETTHWDIERPNKVRKVQPGHWVLVFDGTRAGFLEGPRRRDGSLEGPHLVPAQEWHDFEMDIALFVPAFFDYPAEYLRTEVRDGSTVHLLRVRLPLGGVVEYAVDGKTWLPVVVMLPQWGLERHLGDYREVDGITFFHAFWSSVDREDLTVLDELSFDEDAPPERYALPRGISQSPATSTLEVGGPHRDPPARGPCSTGRLDHRCTHPPHIPPS
jgi:hypothetical protein